MEVLKNIGMILINIYKEKGISITFPPEINTMNNIIKLLSLNTVNITEISYTRNCGSNPFSLSRIYISISFTAYQQVSRHRYQLFSVLKECQKWFRACAHLLNVVFKNSLAF